MNAEQYNIRVILISVCVSIGFFIIALSLIKEGKDLGWFKNSFLKFKIIILIISSILSISVIIYGGLSLATKSDVNSEVEVKEIIVSSGFGGFSIFESYTLYCIKEDGTEIILTVPIYCSKDFKNRVGLIKKGDHILIKYQKIFNSAYYFEFIK